MADILWSTRPEGSRGPRAGLTLNGIAAAGVAIADAEGLSAVSMQHLASQLGVTKMALYRYLPGKRELVALILEHALGPAPDLHGRGWREGLQTWAHTLLAAHLRHPWTVDAVMLARPVGPHELEWMDAAVELLAETNLTGAEQTGVLAALTGQVRIIAQQSREASNAEASFVGAVTAALSPRTERFPFLAAALSTGVHVGDHGHGEDAFAFGLGLVLDGLDSLIRVRAGGGPRVLSSDQTLSSGDTEGAPSQLS